VPTAFVADRRNAIGIGAASWRACFQCSRTLLVSKCLSVDGGDARDQFAAFRGTTLASLLSAGGAACAFAPGAGSSLAAAGQASMQSVACSTDSAAARLRVQLDARAYSLQAAEPSASVSTAEYGATFWPPGAPGAKLYAVLSNRGCAPGACRLEPASCCVAAAAGAKDCGAVQATPSPAAALPAGAARLHLATLTTQAPAAAELVGTCEAAVECDAQSTQFLAIPFYRAALPAAAPAAAPQAPWPATAAAVVQFDVGASAGALGSPGQLRAFNLRRARRRPLPPQQQRTARARADACAARGPRSLVAQLAQAAGVPASSVSIAPPPDPGAPLAARVSFPSGAAGLDAALRLARALHLRTAAPPAAQGLAACNASAIRVRVLDALAPEARPAHQPCTRARARRCRAPAARCAPDWGRGRGRRQALSAPRRACAAPAAVAASLRRANNATQTFGGIPRGAEETCSCMHRRTCSGHPDLIP